MFYTHLSGRGLLLLSGADVYSFLQGLITQDIRLLEAGNPIYAALLSPQGKYLHDFFLYPQEGGILLDGEKARLGDLKSRLALYKLRSKVTIEALPEELGVVAIWDGEKSPLLPPPASGGSEVMFSDPRLPQLGWRLAGNVEESLKWCKAQEFTQASEADYDSMRLALGVPDGSRDMIPDKSLMLECGMDRLGAVSFEKGCYVGQEVTARSHFRGQVRKLLFCVQAKQGALPEAGTPILLNDKDAGQMCSHRGDFGIAMLRLEQVEKAVAENLLFTAGDAKLSASAPAWHEIRMPGQAEA